MDCPKILLPNPTQMDIKDKKKAIVIGSGVGGMATAIRLAARGFEVEVFEKEEHPGGKVSWIAKDGFRWGIGASLLTLPFLIDELFFLCKKNPEDYYRYVSLEVINKYFFSDGTIINAYSDKQKFAEEIQRNTKDSAAQLLQHLKKIEQLYQLSAPVALEKSLHKFSTYTSKEGLQLFLTSPTKLGIFKTMNKKLQNIFVDKNTVQLFSRYATYNGSNPYKAPSILNVIAHPEYNHGAFMLIDGMPSLTMNLHKLAQEMGVTFHFNSLVQSIEYDNSRVLGIKVENTLVQAAYVISNMDIRLTYKHLLPQMTPPKSLIKEALSTSAMIFYWGMDKKYPKLDIHNILFSANYKKEFQDLSLGEIIDDPTIYVFISSKINPNHAIKDGENWFVLINVPHNSGQNWEALKDKFRAIIIQKISNTIGEDIAPHIITEVVNTPATIAAKTASYQGALYGNASNKVFSTFTRHPNFCRKVKNLYFCGGTVHPGGGVPISLLSAKITDALIPS